MSLAKNYNDAFVLVENYKLCTKHCWLFFRTRCIFIIFDGPYWCEKYSDLFEVLRYCCMLLKSMYSLLSFGGLGSKRSIEHVPVKPRPVHATRVTEPCSRPVFTVVNKMLSYRRETALQGALVFAESRRLELRDNILRTLYRSIFNHSDIIGQKICRIRWKKRKNKGY